METKNPRGFLPFKKNRKRSKSLSFSHTLSLSRLVVYDWTHEEGFFCYVEKMAVQPPLSVAGKKFKRMAASWQQSSHHLTLPIHTIPLINRGKANYSFIQRKSQGTERGRDLKVRAGRRECNALPCVQIPRKLLSL